MTKTRAGVDTHLSQPLQRQTKTCSGSAENSYKRTWLLRYISLLYSVFWFIYPPRHPSVTHWAVFAVFYAVFLIAYFSVFRQQGRSGSWRWLAVLFLLGYVYYPFNPSVIGEFVYPVVLSAFFLRQVDAGAAFRRYLLILLLQSGGILLETWLCYGNARRAEVALFYLVAIGISNFAYARQEVFTRLLEKANDEIEHLAHVAERERIARDLHDLLGHTLTVIVLKSDLANRMFELDPAMAHREIAEVEMTAREALAEVREAVSGFRAAGLAAEVLRARRALASAGVQLTTDVDHVAAAAADGNVLCLALREAVTNVLRHSGATVCRLELVRSDVGVRLSFEDNGSGAAGREGNGLRGMRERVTAAGGWLRREAIEGQGSRLLAELPLSLPAPALAEPAAGRLAADRAVAEARMVQA